MDWFAKLQLFAIGFICVVYPVILFILIWSQPTYVIISYFIWIACMVGWIYIGKIEKISEFIVPILIMLLIFTCIYASGYSERDLKEEPFFILITPVCSTPAFCFIGYKLAGYRERKRMDQLHIWIRSLNKSYKKKIEGTNKVIMLIQNVYSEEEKIERILSLLNACDGNDLQKCYGKKITGANQELISQIKGIISEYSLGVEIENKTLRDILDEMKILKCEYKNKLYSEKQIEVNSYSKIKNEYNTVSQKNV